MAMYTTEQAQRRLREISLAYESRAEEQKSDGTVRHKCFISYHAADAVEVLGFVSAFESVFIPKIIGVTEDEPWIDSDDDAYVLSQVQQNYLRDSTVTIVMVGRCTWSRKFVDWEIYSSLRKSTTRTVNGLMGIQLPGAGSLPARLANNVKKNSSGQSTGYARYWVYPGSEQALQDRVEDAFQARRTRDHLIVLGDRRRRANSAC
jgi:hypothetical protein